MNDARIIAIASKYGYKPQSLMMIEEMSEFTKAICKYDRLSDKIHSDIPESEIVECELQLNDCVENLIDEIADVQIMLNQMQYFLNISSTELWERMNKKIERQLERINSIK